MTYIVLQRVNLSTVAQKSQKEVFFAVEPSSVKKFTHEHAHAHRHTHNHFTALCILSGTAWVNRHQKGETRKVKPIWIYWSKR